MELLAAIQYGGFGLAVFLAGLLGWVVKAVIGMLRTDMRDHTAVSREMQLIMTEVRTLLQKQNGRH